MFDTTKGQFIFCFLLQQNEKYEIMYLSHGQRLHDALKTFPLWRVNQLLLSYMEILTVT